MARFNREMLNRGVLMASYGLIALSTPMQDQDIAQIIETLKNDPPSSIDLPEEVAYHYILTEAREADEALVRMIFDLPERFTDTELENAARKSASASPRLQLQIESELLDALALPA